MPYTEPTWWYGSEAGWQAALLSPVAALYGRIAQARYRSAKPYAAKRPVVCIGNFTAGGSGKTPVAIAIAELAAGIGLQPFFLSRGFGGRLKGPLEIDAKTHTAADVGDEPLLLARHGRVVIARDRRAGAQLIEKIAPQSALIIMDDGMQNPALKKDFSISVVDGRRGFGNGRVIPAGPMRAELGFQRQLADAVLIMEPASSATTHKLESLDLQPAYRAAIKPALETPTLAGRTFIAYAGIANPARFFDMIEALGGTVVERATFRDHEMMTQENARQLLSLAKAKNAALITTAKDLVRLTGRSGACAELAQASEELQIKAVFDAGTEAALKAKLAELYAQS